MSQTSKKHLSLDLLYAGFYKVGKWWNFKSLVSPFYRLFLITKGECSITINQTNNYTLKKGELFLVPKFELIDYECSNYMEHYYICLTDNKQENDSVINPALLKKSLHATALDSMLIKRLIEICPNAALPSVDPQIYDNNKTLWESKMLDYNIAEDLEIKGILAQLFSRFITKESLTLFNKQDYLQSRIALTVQYINQHLYQKINVKQLAESIYVSPDHFTKSFKRIIGMSPNEFIQLQRVDYARNLLSTTQIPITEIATTIGFEHCSQFTKMFTQKTGKSPSEYRKSFLEEY